MTVPQGNLGFATDQGEPVLLPPGLHYIQSDTLAYERAFDLSEQVVQLGPYTCITVRWSYQLSLLPLQHYLKSWSSTQKTIALSSGEAELTALVKCSCETIGILQLAADWDMSLEGDIFVDSSAALGVVARKGVSSDMSEWANYGSRKRARMENWLTKR